MLPTDPGRPASPAARGPSPRACGAGADLDRAQLAARTVEVLNVGRFGNPDVLLVESGGERLVVKDFAPRPWLVRQTLGRWVTRREVWAYRALARHPNVPRLVCEIDALAFAVEYRPGARMSFTSFASVPPDFAVRLERAIRGLHERGVAHLDLSHRSNVLLGEDREPVLIDFGSAICFRPGGLAARLLLPLLARVDLRAFRKWCRRLERTRSLLRHPGAG